MVTYVPGTRERDPKKMVMSLQQLGPKTDTNTSNIATNTTNIATNTSAISTINTTLTAMQAAWTSYTPSVTAGTGTFTSVSAAGRYLQIGKTVHISITVTITTNGTAASFINATLPVNGFASGNYILAGREIALTGKMLQGKIASGSSTVATILNYDNTYPGASGNVLVVTGVYESA